MNHLSPVGRRLAVAVAVALAVTAGTAMTAAPALAAPTVPAATSASTAEEQTGPYALGYDEGLFSAGSTGFVTDATPGDGSPTTFQWRRSADGAITPLPSGAHFKPPQASAENDRVAVQTGPYAFRILDMAGGAPVDIDTTSVGEGASLSLLAGDTLVMERYDADDSMSLHLVSKSADTVVHRQVAGLPAGIGIADIVYSPSGALLVRYGPVGSPRLQRLAVVDLATAKVVEDRAVPSLSYDSDIAITADYLAWTERDSSGTATLVTARRGSTETTRSASFPVGGSRAQVSLLGDWALYGVSYQDLSAVSLKDGATVTGLLSNTRGMHRSGEGLLAQGSTQEHGEGLYRITLNAEGKPATTLVATRGARTPVTVVDEQVPATAGFGTAGAEAVLRWRFGRSDLRVDLQLKHKASGKTWTSSQKIVGAATETAFRWDGAFSNGVAAHNGAYEWTLSATALNGIDQVSRTGTLTVASGTAAHDYSDSASPDLLVRDASGRLASYDVRQFLTAPGETPERTERGGGWNIYDRLLSAGNLDATAHSDVLARDTAGVLWLYSNTGHSLATRTKVGGGWNIYDKLAAGSDLTGDGRPDLLATDTAGVLWLYKATGDATKPFAPRTRIGGGWGIYDLLTAPGDIGGAKTGDLLARDSSGVLWLYLGNGDGTFAPRTKVGGGWGAYSQIVSIGDTDRDGRPDLIAENTAGIYPALTVYKGTGDWKAPFGPGTTFLNPAPYTTSPNTRATLF
ncbi:FG-GAP repeat domain-containing protein [Streptomyces sp. NPDC056528]|uniref:FG-GAP repeat domain-containing protein n=1 Tax=Streptomyces sp. NPDC056528 TaxID=3345854 RepID=UPI0036A81950